MIPLKFLSFGTWAPTQVSGRLMLLCANGRYAIDKHSVFPEPGPEKELWGFGHTPKEMRDLPTFQLLKMESSAECMKLYKGLYLAQVSGKGQKLLPWHKILFLSGVGEETESFKERGSPGDAPRDQGRPLPWPSTDSVGSAGGWQSASALQVSVCTHMSENSTGAFLI